MPPVIRLSRLSVLLATVIALVQAVAVAGAQDASPPPGRRSRDSALPSSALP